MKRQVLVGLVVAVIICVAMLLLAVLWLTPGLRRTPLTEHNQKIFEDVGVQVEIPAKTPFISSDSTGVLIMVHEISRGLRAESAYLIKVHVRRMSNGEMDERLEFISRSSGNDSASEYYRWRYRLHPRMDIRKESDLWYIRKDIETPGGEILSVEGEIRVTESAEVDLTEATRIVESIKPTR